MRMAVILAAALCNPMVVAQASDVHWGYAGESGPDAWGGLDPKFTACAEGKNQSPIDLDAQVEAEVPAIEFSYVPGGSEIVNNGHTIQVNYEPGSKITVEGRDFELKQFHFHAPSEHHVNGNSFAMEGHLVHADEDGNLAVVGVLFAEGAANAGLETGQDMLPAEPGQVALNARANAELLLPEDRSHYRYNGSLTTPPCSEGVVWLVLKRPVTASAGQIEKLSEAMGHANNRPLQPVNARPVLE